MRLAQLELAGGVALAAAVATALTAFTGDARSAPDVGPRADAVEYRVVLTSNRDGETRGYSVRPDGSRLSPLLPARRGLTPLLLSPDNRMIAYSGPDESIFVSRADGTHLRRLVARAGIVESFSPDGELLAFTLQDRPGIRIVGVNGRGLRRLSSGDDGFVEWSPDGKRFAFLREHHDQRFSLFVRPLRGKARLLVRTGPNDVNVPWPDWSPNGRWIAYHTLERDVRASGLWLVRPDGRGRHRVTPPADPEATLSLQWSPDSRWIAERAFGFDEKRDGLWLVRPDGRRRHRLSGDAIGYAWSPDSTRLAFVRDDGVRVVTVAGGSVPLHRDAAQLSWVAWSPDGRRLALVGRSEFAIQDVWTAAADLTGFRRITSEGTSELIGWTPLAPRRPEATPLRPTETVSGPDTLATTTPIAVLAADGARVAFVARSTPADCEHVAVWSPGAPTIVRLGRRPGPCPNRGSRVSELAAAGSRIAWASVALDDLSWVLASTDVGDRVRAIVDACEDCSRPSEFHVHGDGDLLVFNEGSAVVRIGGAQPCPIASTRACTTLRRGAHTATVESVAGGLIAVHEPEVVSVLDERGELVRVFPFAPADVSAARLDGGRLVVWRFGVIESYEIATGTRVLSRPMPAGYRLADVDGGIAVLLQGNAIQLVRLADGRSLTLTPGREPTLADLEPTGLYQSYGTSDGGGRVAFVPRAELVVRLEGGAR